MPAVHQPRRPRASPLCQLIHHLFQTTIVTLRDTFPTDFLAAAIEHIPPKGEQAIRYYGLYSNKTRGLTRPTAEVIPVPAPTSKNLESEISNLKSEVHPSPQKATARPMRPLWRDIISILKRS